MDDWEKRYRDGDTPWEKGAPSPGLLDFLGTRRMAGRVLVPGCGLGHDVRAISDADNRVLGVDVAPSAIAAAEAFPEVAGEEYQTADLFDLPRELESQFDWVWEHTCFCAIDPARRSDYVDGVRFALRDGGHLLAVFYLDPGDGKGPPFGVTRAELDALFAPVFELLEEWVPLHAYPGREDRELMRLLRKR